MWRRKGRRGRGKSPEQGGYPKERGCFVWWPGERRVFACFFVWGKNKGRVASGSAAPADVVAFEYDLFLNFFVSLTMSTWGDLHPVLYVGCGPGMVCDSSWEQMWESVRKAKKCRDLEGAVSWRSLLACISPHPMSLKRILIECINALLTQTQNVAACWLTGTSVFLPGLLKNLAMWGEACSRNIAGRLKT